MARLFRVKRPYDHQEEARTMIGARHGCEQGEQWDRLGEIRDAVVFPIGAYGAGHPAGSVFEIVATEPCEACGTLLRAWGQWVVPTVIDLGA